MRARVRSLGIILTIIFVGLMFYAGFMLFQLPEKVVDAINIENNSQVEGIRRIVDNDKIPFRERLQEIEKRLAKQGMKRTEKIALAEQATSSTIQVVGLMVLSGLFLMILIFAASFKTSAETIVYLDKKEDELDDESDQKHNQKGLLEGIEEQLNQQLKAKNKSWGKDDFEGAIRLICTGLKAGAGILYEAKEKQKDKRKIELIAGYALVLPDSGTLVYEYGEGLAGQVAKTKQPLRVSNLPDGYMKVFSGLGEATPPFLTVFPVLKEGITQGVLEIATFQAINDKDFERLENFCLKLASKF